ncbi:MAG: IS5 family transposase [Candidatus Lokiarchaeota archaeon]|nr:IS5 family transposase [Candidatus Lokiarchaeota archaeon]
MAYDRSYNAAKARRFYYLLQELMSLCNTIPDVRSHRGRPVEFPLPVLFVLLGLKFDARLGYRDFVAWLALQPELLVRLGLQRPPSHTLLNGALKRLDTRLLHRLYEVVARKQPPPRWVAVDATGFSHATGGEWLSVRFKKTRKRRFHALHAAVDTESLLVHAARVRARPGGDAKHLVSLLRRVPASHLATVYGDKAYISKKNAQFVTELGAYPAIEPKRNLRARSRGHRGYGQLLREYRANPDKWKRTHQYGQRSLAETVFSMLKVRFSGSLSSRGYKERRRELLIKVLLHNIQQVNFLECTAR